MDNDDIISMPDKWEYPWYAAWDLAFHMLAFQTVDSDFAKSQLDLILRNDYLHPNGQMPAYAQRHCRALCGAVLLSGNQCLYGPFVHLSLMVPTNLVFHLAFAGWHRLHRQKPTETDATG